MTKNQKKQFEELERKNPVRPVKTHEPVLLKFKDAQRKSEKIRRSFIKNATPEKKKVKFFLREINVRAMFMKSFIKPTLTIVDFYLPKPQAIIEVGVASRSAFRGYPTLFITNEQVQSGEYRDLISKFVSP